MPKRVRVVWVITCIVILLGFLYVAVKNQSEQKREDYQRRAEEAQKQYADKLEKKKAATIAGKRIGDLRELVASGKNAEAEKLAAEIIAQDPNAAMAYTWWGAVLVNEDQLPAALDKFSTSARLDPNQAKTYHLWGLTLDKLGRYQEAINKYENALLLDPENSKGYTYWGAALVKLGDHERAVQKLQKALDLNPHNELANGILVDAYFHLQQYAKAWEAVRLARKLNLMIPEGTLKRLQAASPEPG